MPNRFDYTKEAYQSGRVVKNQVSAARWKREDYDDEFKSGAKQSAKWSRSWDAEWDEKVKRGNRN